MEEFVVNVVVKFGVEVEIIGGVLVVEDGLFFGGFVLSYLDDEGDLVFIIIDQDFLEVIFLVCYGYCEKVDFFVYYFN